MRAFTLLLALVLLVLVIVVEFKLELGCRALDCLHEGCLVILAGLELKLHASWTLQ